MTRSVISAKATFLIAVTAMGLSACSANTAAKDPVTPALDTPDPVLDPAMQALMAFQTAGAAGASLEAEVLALPGSLFAAVPAVGTAVFTGSGTVGMDLGADATDDVAFEALGDASVTIDFANDTVVGSLTNLSGIVGTAAEVAASTDPASLVAVDGSLTLSNLDIFGPDRSIVLAEGEVAVARRPAFGVSYAGTLTAADVDYAVAGRSTGLFRGTRADPANGFPIKALSIQDTDGVATVGTGDTATTFPVEINIFATNP